MRTTACLVSVLALMAALPAAAMAQAATTAATSPATPTYTAAQFFDTVSYGLGYGGAKAFSPDGKSVLIWSDKTGSSTPMPCPSPVATRSH